MIAPISDKIETNFQDSYQIDQESFSGPLDLLLHLIKKNEVDIFEIDITSLTDQYVAYIKTIDTSNIENAGDFLIMAASLLEIKSRALLPKEDSGEESEEEDLRANLIQQLLEYKKFKSLTQGLAQQQVEFEETYPNQGAYKPTKEEESIPAELSVSLNSLILSISKVVKDTALDVVHKLRSKVTPLSSFLQMIRDKLSVKATSFFEVRKEQSDPVEWISTFLAILELCKSRGINATQPIFFGDIFISSSGESEEATSITSGQEHSEEAMQN